MSDRPTEQRPPVSTGDAIQATRQRGSSSSAAQPPRPTTTGPPTILSPVRQRPSQDSARGFELPPLDQALSGAGGNFSASPSRLAAFSTILNPVQDDSLPQNRRRKASELQSPLTSASSLPPLTIGTSYPPSSVLSTPRRILTPRSPSLHRAASLSQLNPATGSINAQQAPFPPSPRHRVYTVEPGVSGAPPLPPPPGASRLTYGFSAPTRPNEAAHQEIMGATGATRALSSSASPSTSYSSYSQSGQLSPSASYAPMSMPVSASRYSSAEGAYGGSRRASVPSGSMDQERQRPMGIPISSSAGQNVYQMMTLETTSGTVQLPVDVQAASRVADEKRRRNAGASARFRQRRKEKEREASTTISSLEQRIKDIGEDLDFYKRERDYLASVVLQVPGGDRHFPRPASPRRRRSSSAIPGPAGGLYGVSRDQTPRSPGDGRNVRRRTSTISLPPPPPPQTAMAQHAAGSVFSPGFTPQYGAPLAPHRPALLQQAPPGPMASPSPRGAMLAPASLPRTQAQQQLPPAPPQLMQAPSQSGPFNPYASDRQHHGPAGSRDSR